MSSDKFKRGVVKTCDVKVIRRKYSVCFGTGTSVQGLIAMLKELPVNAEFDECDIDDTGDNAYIEFHYEYREDDK
jgi:hypothetical protein